MATIQVICPSCGITFEARSLLAVYCSSTCKCRAAYYRRQGRPIPATKQTWARTEPIRPQVVQPTIIDDDENDLPASWRVPPAGTEERFWHGTAIQRRQADGFVNATAMCKANGREWFTYARSARTQEYIVALKAAPQICGTEVVQSISGGIPALQGTWIHPRLAIDLARWISPAFAVWMDGWFLESLANPAQASPAQIERGIHIVASSKRDAHLMWTAALRTELVASLQLLDQELFGSAMAPPAPVRVHVPA